MPKFEVWLQSGSYKLANKLSWVDGVCWLLDQMKIKLTQSKVELNLGLSLAKIQHSLKKTFFGTPFSYPNSMIVLFFFSQLTQKIVTTN